MLFAISSSRRNCCSGFQPVHRYRGPHLKAPFCHAARSSHRPPKVATQHRARLANRRKPEILVLVHQGVQEVALIRPRKADLDLRKGEAPGASRWVGPDSIRSRLDMRGTWHVQRGNGRGNSQPPQRHAIVPYGTCGASPARRRVQRG